jgi:hypothetical protein
VEHAAQRSAQPLDQFGVKTASPEGATEMLDLFKLSAIDYDERYVWRRSSIALVRARQLYVRDPGVTHVAQRSVQPLDQFGVKTMSPEGATENG